MNDTVCPAEIPSAVAVALSAIGSGSVIVINPHLGGRPTHEYITRSNKRDLQRYSTLKMNTNKATEGLYCVVEHKDDIQSFAACFYVKQAKTNNTCLCKIATSVNANKPKTAAIVDFHHLLKYTHFRRTRWNDNMCTDVCTRFGLDAMARGQSRPVQTAGMRHSTQDKQVWLKMT